MPIDHVNESEKGRQDELLDEVTLKIINAQRSIVSDTRMTADQFLDVISGIGDLLYSIKIAKLDAIGFEKVGRLGNSEWKSLLSLSWYFREHSQECEQEMRLIEGHLTDLLSSAVRELVRQKDPMVSDIVSQTRRNLHISAPKHTQ